ncbi:MAG: sulfotransferase [Pseudomonadota bacterium]
MDERVLFCVGAQKAGTTWLHAYFQAHPEIHVPLVKEMHYFDDRFGPEAGQFAKRRAARAPKGPAAGGAPLSYPSPAYTAALLSMHRDPTSDHTAYRRLLSDGARPGQVLADITPSYALLDQFGFAEMMRAFPCARFLFILRDPVNRLWSSLRMLHDERRGSDQTASPAALAERYLKGGLAHVRRRGAYDRTIAALDASVPPDRMLFVFYEDLFTDASLKRICSHIGVRAWPGDFASTVRGGRAAPLPDDLAGRLYADLAPIYARLETRFPGRLPASWRRMETVTPN